MGSARPHPIHIDVPANQSIANTQPPQAAMKAVFLLLPSRLDYLYEAEVNTEQHRFCFHTCRRGI